MTGGNYQKDLSWDAELGKRSHSRPGMKSVWSRNDTRRSICDVEGGNSLTPQPRLSLLHLKICPHSIFGDASSENVAICEIKLSSRCLISHVKPKCVAFLSPVGGHY